MKGLFIILCCILFGAAAGAQEQQDSGSYDQLIGVARTLFKDQKLSDADRLCETAIRLDPKRWEAYALAGSILGIQKHYKEAVLFLTNAVNRAPEERKLGLQQALAQAKVSAEETPAVPPPTATPTQSEIVLWKTIENSRNPDDFQVYLSQYPNGTFAVLAKSRIPNLKEEQRTAAEKAKVATEQMILGQKAQSKLRELTSMPLDFGKSKIRISESIEAFDGCVLRTVRRDSILKSQFLEETHRTIPLSDLDPEKVLKATLGVDKEHLWQLNIFTYGQQQTIQSSSSKIYGDFALHGFGPSVTKRESSNSSAGVARVFIFQTAELATQAAEAIGVLIRSCQTRSNP